MLFMLIDAADPRYHRPPPPEARRRPPSIRVPVGVWLPLVAAIVCLAAAGSVSPLAGYLLAMSSLGLFFRAGVALLPRGDGLPKHRQ